MRPARPAHRLIALVHGRWTVRRRWCSCRDGSTTPIACSATTSAGTPAPAAGGPFTVDAHVADLAALLGGRRAVLFGHSYGNVARSPSVVPIWCVPWPPTSRRCRGCRGGRAAQSAEWPAEGTRRARRSSSCAAWSGTSGEALPEPRNARIATRRGLVEEVTDLAATAPWHPDRVEVPVVAMYGLLTEASRGGCHYLAGLLSDRPAIAIEVPATAARTPTPRRSPVSCASSRLGRRCERQETATVVVVVGASGPSTASPVRER